MAFILLFSIVFVITVTIVAALVYTGIAARHKKKALLEVWLWDL